MALSGSLSNPFKTGYRIQIDWSATQNVGANTSTITANFYLISTGSSYNINASAAKALSIVIDGTTYSYSVNVTIAPGQTKLLATATHTIAHNADGTRSFAISGALAINITLSGSYYGTISIASQAFALNTIPRATYPTLSATSANMGTAITIATNRASTEFSHTLRYEINGVKNTIATGVATGYTWTIPLALASYIPNAASGVCYIACDTYNGSTCIGTQWASFTIVVPDTIVPTISSVTIAEAVAGIAAKFSGYIQNKSKANVTIVAAGASGSTIAAYSTTILGVTYPGASFVSGFLSASGVVAVVTTVTDSRGRQKSVTNNITVMPYFNPSISLFACQRCLASGTPNEDGTSLYANIKFDVATVNNKNDKSWKVEYRISGSGSWTSLTSGSSYTYNTVYKELTGKFSIDNAYELKLTITDYFGSISTTAAVATAFTLLDFSASGKGFAIGQVSTADLFEVGMPTVFKDKVFLSEADRVADRDASVRVAADWIVEERHTQPLDGNVKESWWYEKWYSGRFKASILLRTAFNAGTAWTPGQYHLSEIFSLPVPLKKARTIGVHQNEEMLGSHVGNKWYRDTNGVSNRMSFYINNSTVGAMTWAGDWIIQIEGIWRELVNDQWVEVTGGA